MTFYTIKSSKKDDDEIGFKDAHQMMAYFKSQIYEDYKSITQQNNSELLAVFSRILNPDLKFSFKTISAGTKSINGVYKQLFPNGNKYTIRWARYFFKSVPQNYRYLIKWEEKDDCFKATPQTWKEFFAENCSKENPILSKEEMIYAL